MSGEATRAIVNVSMSVSVELDPGEVLGKYDPKPERMTVDAALKAIASERDVARFLGDWGIASWDDASVNVVLLDGDRTVALADVGALIARRREATP